MSLTPQAAGMTSYNVALITGGRPTPECEPTSVVVPHSMGLVSSLIVSLYEYAGGFNAINSGPLKVDCFAHVVR